MGIGKLPIKRTYVFTQIIGVRVEKALKEAEHALRSKGIDVAELERVAIREALLGALKEFENKEAA